MRLLLPALLLAAGAAPQDRKPNVILVITDDQGYGDLGCHGNPRIRTPHLDAFAKQSVRLSAFCVSPVCSPTRSSLLTGRYNYRTGVVDTYLGRSMMHADELTLAEILAAAGYRTGIFGKWHLGDNYPLRAMDQGFQESLVIRGGGIGQPSDPPGGDHYTDPTLYRNGAAFKSKGYCSDVFTDAALEFVAAHKSRPFFVYLPFNAPHTPLEAPESYRKPYHDAGLQDPTAGVYAMVTNIDDNMGRLLAKLDELGLARDTIVIFMSDNGPQQPRFNGGLRGLKGTVFEGGIRVPFYIRWPGRFPAAREIATPAAHIDVTPTLLEACGVAAPAAVKVDGVSLLPLLKGERADLPDRTLFFQWHRGDVPEKFRACAARAARWKLVRLLPKDKPMLFDLQNDPSESKDVSGENPAVVERLTREYEAWFEDVRGSRNFAPPHIKVGTPHEDPVVLTRQDWRGPKAGGGKDAEGSWDLEVEKETTFRVKILFRAPGSETSVQFSCGTEKALTIAADATSASFEDVRIPAGPHSLRVQIGKSPRTYGADYVELKRVD